MSRDGQQSRIALAEASLIHRACFLHQQRSHIADTHCCCSVPLQLETLSSRLAVQKVRHRV